MESAKVLRVRREAVEAFQAAFSDLLAVSRDVSNYGTMPVLQPQPTRLQEFNRRRFDAERLCVPAAKVLEQYGLTVNWKRSGTMNLTPVNPALVWTTIFTDQPMTTPDLVTGTCIRAIGLLDHEIAEAELRESTLEGRVARAAAKPRGLWRALRGAPAEAVEHKSAFVSGVIATLAGLVVAYLAYRFGWAS